MFEAKRLKFSWITRDEQYHEQHTFGVSTALQYFIKLFFDHEIKSIHVEIKEQ